MVADYSFYVKTIETHARAFLSLNILAISRVHWSLSDLMIWVHRTQNISSFLPSAAFNWDIQLPFNGKFVKMKAQNSQSDYTHFKWLLMCEIFGFSLLSFPQNERKMY